MKMFCLLLTCIESDGHICGDFDLMMSNSMLSGSDLENMTRERDKMVKGKPDFSLYLCSDCK